MVYYYDFVVYLYGFQLIVGYVDCGCIYVVVQGVQFFGYVFVKFCVQCVEWFVYYEGFGFVYDCVVKGNLLMVFVRQIVDWLVKDFFDVQNLGYFGNFVFDLVF